MSCWVGQTAWLIIAIRVIIVIIVIVVIIVTIVIIVIIVINPLIKWPPDKAQHEIWKTALC